MGVKELSETLNNPHFNQFAAILSVAMSARWRMAHPEFPNVWTTLNRLARLNKGLSKKNREYRNTFIAEWTDLFMNLTDTDTDLQYSTDDATWFIEILDGDDEQAKATFSMLFAVASTKNELIALEDAAKLLGKAESTLRNDAAAGKILAAEKIGKSWFFNTLGLRAYYRAKLPSPLNIEIEKE